MSRDFRMEENDHTMKLEKLTNFHYLLEGLKKRFAQDMPYTKQVDEEIKRYEENIKEYHTLLIEMEDLKKAKPDYDPCSETSIPDSPEKIATPVTHKSCLETITTNAIPHFQQGLEMFLTSQTMNINSQPLLEYYSFLQCVKGNLLLNLEIKDYNLLNYHGIKAAKRTRDVIIRAKVKYFGVFQTLFLLKKPKHVNDSSYDMKKYLNGDYYLTLESLVKERLLEKRKDGNDYNKHRIANDDPMPAFIISNLLSTLVRYYPRKWQEICLGIKTDLILDINKWRRNIFPDAFAKLLPIFN